MFTAVFKKQSVLTYWMGHEWAHSAQSWAQSALLSILRINSWNPNHRSYVSTRLLRADYIRCLKLLTSEERN